MENRITTGTFVALACSAMLAYAAPQQRPNAGAPPGATGTGNTKDQTQRTIVGCLQQGSSARSFVLVQTPGTSVPNGGVGSVGGREEQGIRYDLVADTKTDLSKMVGHKVEVIGTETIPAPLNSRATGDREQRPEGATLSRFTAKSVKDTGAC